jgi:glycosyltransferase involved in cell wall biosynthesis
MMGKSVYLSVVVPVFNEAGNIEKLIPRLYNVLAKLKGGFEIIVVDDGSKDATFSLLKELKKEYKTLKIIRFKKNFGQTAALDCGFKFSQGEVIVAIDGDGQNDPQDIPRLLEKIKAGYELVSGWRKERKEPFFTRRLPSFIANKFISWISKVKLHDFGCTLKAYRREIIKDLHLYGEMHRFIPALLSPQGVRLTEIEVKDHPRETGRSKYGILRSFRVCLDLIKVKFLLTYSISPMQLFGGIGFIAFLFAFIGTGFLIYHKLSGIPFTRNPLLMLTALFCLIGVQFIILGLLAEMLTRIYYEFQNKTTYTIQEIV